MAPEKERLHKTLEQQNTVNDPQYLKQFVSEIDQLGSVQCQVLELEVTTGHNTEEFWPR